MMKRILMIALTLLLLTGIAARAEDAEEIYGKLDNAQYRIVLRSGDGDTTLGSGVLYTDQRTILTALSCCAEGELYALGNDGEHKVLSWDAVGNAGAAVITLATPSSAKPLTLADGDGDIEPLPFLLGANATDMLGAVPVYNIQVGKLDSQDTLIVYGDDGLLPGGIMADSKGRIIGLMIAQHTEGVGSYIGLDAVILGKALAGASEEANSSLDVTLSWKDGLLIISWEDDERAGGKYVVSLSSDENEYYVDYVVENSERRLAVAVPPGHTYYVQVQRNENVSVPVWEEMKLITLPNVAFNAHGFTQECYLAETPMGTSVEFVLPEMTEITAESLTDPGKDIYLQIKSAYDDSFEGEVPMVLELIAPDGQFFFEEMTFVFSPEYAKDDCFALPLDDLISDCIDSSDGVLKAGNYRVRYALNSQVAGECAFTLADSGKATAPAPVGFAAGLTATDENGLITLTWDAASIPEGAKAMAFLLYENNLYFTYQPIEEGVSTAQFFAIPGRRAAAWVSWATEGDPSAVIPRDATERVVINAVEEAPLRINSFQNQRIGLMPSGDPDAAAKGEFLDQQPLTREMLSDRDTPIYFQTEDTYQVSSTSPDHPLVIVLLTPEGLSFVDPGFYTFDLALQSSDLWLRDISQLFASYESLVDANAWPAGEYRILYCIDEKVAGEFTFTLD